MEHGGLWNKLEQVVPSTRINLFSEQVGTIGSVTMLFTEQIGTSRCENNRKQDDQPTCNKSFFICDSPAVELQTKDHIWKWSREQR